MSLTPQELCDLAQNACMAAKRAARLIQGYSGTQIDIQHKPVGSQLASQLVTEVDLRSETVIIETLSPTFERFDLALLAEEGGDDGSRLQNAYFWCIDPLDGTQSFIEGDAGYAVSIALVSRTGIPAIGVVYDPATDTCYCAISGQGVTRNGVALHIPTVANDQQCALTLVCDRSMTLKANYPQLCEALKSIALKQGMSGLEVVPAGGAVMNACMAMNSPPACYFKCPKAEAGGGSLWDFAATALIYTELGMFVGDFYGQRLELNRRESTFMNHRGVLFCTDAVLAEEIQGLIELC